jgi:pimeloyl-ACP methyl ester carboxylesterase
MTADDLDVTTVGAGPDVVFVHGSIVGAEVTWRCQLELAERWRLRLVQRPGFGASPPLPGGGDFEAEAPLVADLLGDGAHLVAHSYGAVIALHAAALRPEAVRSLTVSEPGSLRIAAHVPAVAEAIAGGDLLYARRAQLEPREFLTYFRSGVGSAHETPDELPEALRRGAAHAMTERASWDGDVPLAALATAPFGKLVVSGGHSAIFEPVCDVLAAAIGAQRAVVQGRGHTIPLTGAPYNERLERFLREGA